MHTYEDPWEKYHIGLGWRLAQYDSFNDPLSIYFRITPLSIYITITVTTVSLLENVIYDITKQDMFNMHTDTQTIAFDWDSAIVVKISLQIK